MILFAHRSFLILACLFSIPGASAASPLHPEDGSARVTHWTIANRGATGIFDYVAFRAGMKREGIQLRILADIPNSYLQDLGFMSDDGGWVSNANYPSVLGNDALFEGLTMNVANEEWGPVFVSPDRATQGGMRVNRQMKITFAEGGALISGRRASGTPYIIAEESVIDRAIAFAGLSRANTIQQVAEDLGVLEQDLILVSSGKHLDLLMLATPGGKILLSDPRLNPSLIAEALTLSKKTQERHELFQLKATSESLLTSNTWEGQSLRTTLQSLDEMERVLKQAGLEVVRIPGSIPDPSHDRHWINFFNGFLGRNASNQLFFFTNSTRGLPSLETAFSRLLATETKIDPDRVYLVGSYSDGAGIDCAGVPSYETP